MAKRNDLKIQAELLEEILALEKKISKQSEASAYQQKRLNGLKNAEFVMESKKISLTKQINDIQKSALGVASKKLGLEQQFKTLGDLAKVGTKKQIDQAKKLTAIMGGVADGSKDFADALEEIGSGKFDKLNGAAEEFGTLLKDNNKNLEQTIKDASKVKKGFDTVLDTLGVMDLKKTFTMAGALAAITSFALKAKEVKNTLGTTGLESARVAGNMTAAGTAARLMGGNVQEAEAAVTAMVDEFGTLNVLSLETSLSLGAMVSDTGLTGANAAKLLKSMESISTASIETNMNLISSTAELARAEGVAPAQVLNDIAESTETFALFAKDGGKNIAKAAIEARKLGLNLGTVAGIADNLLDFESSIGAEMEASMLLGRQMSLDKARELALTGDLAGLAEEVKNQVGSQAEFEAMNVVQRKALAAAIGVSVADLGKMVAGEKTSAEIAKDKAATQAKQLSLEKQLAYVTAAGAVAQIFASLAKIPFGLGLLAAGGAALGMYGMMRSAPKLEKGGVVKETGMAVVHKGEVFSGTRNEMGMGNGKTNQLLRELITQNEFLMNRLTNRVGDMALSN